MANNFQNKENRLFSEISQKYTTSAHSAETNKQHSSLLKLPHGVQVSSNARSTARGTDHNI